MEHASVSNLREYLRIKTVQPSPDYDAAVDFLTRLAVELELEVTVIQVTPGYPLVIMTWHGSDPSLSSVALSSHMDVVPAYAEMWICDPFLGYKAENGDIYGRGVQDMKSVGIQYIEALRKLKATTFKPLRTIHVLFTPEEEVGSVNGMKDFVLMKEFKDLNIGCVMDEGLASPTEEFVVYQGQKVNYAVRVECNGNTGHGSQLINNTAGEKMRRVLNEMLNFREAEKARVENGNATLSDVFVINLTKLQGGVQTNVLPMTLSAYFDVRAPRTVSVTEMAQLMNKLVDIDGVSWEYCAKLSNPTPLSSVDPIDPWWSALSKALEIQNCNFRTEIFAAGTDCRFITPLGIPAYCFSPMNNTPILLHDHNEFLNESVFLRGIDIYKEIVKQLSSVANK